MGMNQKQARFFNLACCILLPYLMPFQIMLRIKGGGANANHGHMDAGSFVLEWGGVRWAKDLGAQDYDSLERLGLDLWNMKPDSPRWQVFRLGSEAHNTLTLDGQPHSATGMATLTQLDARCVEIDLGPVLGVPARRVARFSDAAVDIEDHIDVAPGRRVRWAMATEAELRLSATTAQLAFGQQRLRLDFSGTPVTLSSLDISLPRRSYDHPNPGTRQLIATAVAPADGRVRLTVRFRRAEVEG